MAWFERIVGAALALVGALAVTPTDLLLVYLQRNPVAFLSEVGRRAWQLELAGLTLILGGVLLILTSWRRGRR